MRTSLFLLTALIAAAATAQDTPADLPLGCLIQADEVAEVGTAVTGIIARVEVDRGDRVRAGQVVATLRDSVERAQIDVARTRVQIEADIRAAQASLDLATDRLTRARNLHARAFISAQALEQATVEHRVAREKLRQAQDFQQVSRRELELAEARLGERVIRSPFDGVVTDRYLSTGERIEEKALLRVARLHPLRVEVVLPNTLYGKVAPGMAADIQADLPGLDTLHATVTRVDNVIDAASNTFRARLTLPNADYAIPAGLRCTAAFVDRADTAGVRPASLERPATSAPSGLRLDFSLPQLRSAGNAAPRRM
ncbi:MAG: efflux RND transporter periplasmic adaptor subunit [Rhodocyclaceae bacterium]|nr:efflux RND transporter periplasmic adaptor subunit [Rhodocyclaceae bacterium]